MKSILADFEIKEDTEISSYIESQLEAMIMCSVLSLDYNNGIKKYPCCKLTNVYFNLKEAYKDFEKSRWRSAIYESLIIRE